MKSISHRADLGQDIQHRAASGLSALPAGIVRGVICGVRAWIEFRRELRQLEAHVVHDVGFQVPSGAPRSPRHEAGAAPDIRSRNNAARRHGHARTQ